MKRIILLLFILITFGSLLYADSNSNINKQVDELLRSGLIASSNPFSHDAKILIKLQGNPSKEDSLIFKELVDTLNVLIEVWDLHLISKGESNLLVDINKPDRKNEMNKVIGHKDNTSEIVRRTVVLNIPPESDYLQRKKIIYYYMFRSLVILNGGPNKTKAIPGSIFTENDPEKVTFHPVDYKLIQKKYSTKNQEKFNYGMKFAFGKIPYPLLFNLLGFLISYSFLIYLSLKGKFNDHHYQFKPFLKQGFLVVIACTFYILGSKSISVSPISQGIMIIPGLIIGLFSIAFIIICLIFLIERAILKESNNFLLQILVPFFSIVLLVTLFLVVFLLFGPDNSMYIYSIGISGAAFYALVIGFIRSIYIFTRLKSENIIRKKDVELAKMSEFQKQAELQSLRAKINPHFLYNALNSIASLATTDARKTEQMALALSDFFKYAINREQKQLNTLSEELNATRTYLEIEKVRFGDRLSFEIDCPEDLLNIQIPQLLIQPLVENAIKHGLSQITENGLIRISVSKDKTQLKIRVYDNGPAFPDGPLTGFGIQNTQERIALLYGGKASVNWENGANKYIEISIPI